MSRELHSNQGTSTRKVAMSLFAAAILCLLGFLQSFGTSQYRSTDGRLVDGKDSGSQPADLKARCFLTCCFHRMDHNRMDSYGAFKVSRTPEYIVHSYLCLNHSLHSSCYARRFKKSKYVKLCKLKNAMK